MSDARVHLAIPTKADVSFWSGSLPVVMSVPNSDDRKKELKIFSYHVKGVLSWQLDNLKECVDKLEIDAIALQGISSYGMITHLQNILGTEWGFLIDMSLRSSDFPEQFIFYRRTALILASEKVNEKNCNTVSATFFSQRLLKNFIIHNVSSSLGIAQEKIENYYKQLLLRKEDAEISVIVGSLGFKIAPSHTDRLFNLTTSVTDNLKGYYLPDYSIGGYFTNSKGEIRQLNTVVVDIQNGARVIDERSLHTVTEPMSADEKMHWLTSHPVLRIDAMYEGNFYVGGKKFLVYEKELKEELKDESLLVSPAATPFNQQDVCIRLKAGKHAPATLLTSLYPKDFRVAEKIYDNGAYVELFGKDEESNPALSNAINNVISINNKIRELNQQLFEEINKSANELYGKTTNTALWLLSFGFYSSRRENRVKTRVELVSDTLQTSQEKILVILKDPATGDDLKSFKYFLASCLTGVKAKEDAQAKALIDYVIGQLEAHIVEHKQKMEVKEKAEEPPPIVRRLSKTGSSDKL